MNKTTIFLIVAVTFLALCSTVLGDQIPVSNAGLPRYAGTNPVQLDGTGSYDPDNSGELSYQWQ